jgi:selenide, water dikinase
MNTNDNPIRLTQFSHGAGCGCKISPRVLDTILNSTQAPIYDPRLLVGNSSRDDAAVYDMGNGKALISTTDFFMPIVDDPFTFGQIAATNAISDVYAMGGKPLLAIAILGWPVNTIPAEVAQQVLDGARETCARAGIVIAGGHSIDSLEPIFGLAVNGEVEIAKLKRNDTATEGCNLYLTKPLGVGILTTAQKQGKLLPADAGLAIDSMIRLNSIGMTLSENPGVTAMTDVTGFGLLGHLAELCNGSRLSAILELDNIPRLASVDDYIAKGCIPGGTHRNWESYGCMIKVKNETDRLLLCDPQTSGGLLLAVTKEAAPEVEDLLSKHGMPSAPIGRLTSHEEILIRVE